MKVDLLHNKVICDTATPSFRESFNANLVPKLAEKYGNAIIEVQMYEDFLSDNFVLDGEFYYPLTLVFDNEIKTEWIKWNISDKKRFEKLVPYAYIGDGQIDFSFAEDVPEEFKTKLSGRSVYYNANDAAPLNVRTSATDKTFLSGKYSQSFVDLMAREITKCIEKAFSVSGSSKGGFELMLVFAPETYMEHVVENVTYRRLLITARGCAARDLWIKWTNLAGKAPLSVSATVNPDEVRFELGEDVSHKIREKEYRFLVRASSEKYQYAMGRKNITDWRELVKRVIKRGELIKCENPLAVDNAYDVSLKSEPLMVEEAEKIVQSVNEVTVPAETVTYNDDITAKLQEVLASSTQIENKETAEVDNSDLAALLRDALGTSQKAEDMPDCAEEILESVEADNTPNNDFNEDELEKEIERLEVKIQSEDELKLREDELRRKIEAEMRERIELETKRKHEEENLELLREHERLKAENERLSELARKMEDEKARKEEEQKAESERLRQEIEARERAEQREKERLAESARLAIIEQQRLESVRAEQEAERARDEQRLLEEARKLEEARLEMERQAEEERLRKEREELEKKAKAPETVYMSKNARLLFRRPVDPNITKRIHEIILTTIKYFHKEDVYIKIKATVPDSTTVNLHFVKIPAEENELLINIIKVLGKSDLGITKVFLE